MAKDVCPSAGVAQGGSDILYSIETSSAECPNMRLIASLTSLTLVLALSSCDSSTFSNSSSRSPLVGSWKFTNYIDSFYGTGANGSPNDSLFALTGTTSLTFNADGSAKTNILATTIFLKTGKTIVTESTTTNFTWITDGDTIFESEYGAGVTSSIYSLSSNNMNLTLQGPVTPIEVFTRQ